MSTNWKFLNCKEKPLLLFSCLDWGLGHTTRSIPLIKEFLNLGCDLIVACNSIQKDLLEPEFPQIRFVQLPGYGVSYGKTAWQTRFNLLLQIGKILIRIKNERRWLNLFLKDNDVDGLISDNRYGFYHPELPSVIITHQLSIQSGYGWLANQITQKFIYNFVNRFSACWVPDFKEHAILGGKLSHPTSCPKVPVQYIGPVSRFRACTAAVQNKFDVLVIVSGPEPQRSVFEQMILRESSSIKNKKIALVRGLPSSNEKLDADNITTFNHLGVAEMNSLICESELIVCRSGYTTVMDMMKLKKKMIVIPTPGQPEQEYLAGYLSAANYVLKFKQSQFSLRYALQKASNFTFNHVHTNMDEYKVVLKDFVEKISSLSPSSTY